MRFGKSSSDGTRFPKIRSANKSCGSADSIGANIAEGTGRHNFQDNQRFVKIARESLNETQHFLRRAFKRNLLTPADVKKLKPLVDNLASQLNSYLKSIGRDRKGE
jgi:four helix bundle protein